MSAARTVLKIQDDFVFVRHSSLCPGRPTVLLLHGLGDSSLAFNAAFSRNELADLNVVAPDFPGHGCSLPARDGIYTLEALALRVAALIELMDLRLITMVGHSLGGDVATVLASRGHVSRIARVVSVEGTMTPTDSFICNRATDSAAGGFRAFETWFRERFCQETVLEGWAQEGESGRCYYASLRFCDPRAFLACAVELYSRNRHADAQGLSGIGALYATLAMPKQFIYGTKSLPTASRQLIDKLGVESRALPAGHWVMIDAEQEFYPLLRRFVCC